MIKAIIMIGGTFQCTFHAKDDSEMQGIKRGIDIISDILCEQVNVWTADDLSECDKDFPHCSQFIREHLIEKPVED